jgi:hypothetical protein
MQVCALQIYVHINTYARSRKECSINNPEAKKNLVDGWVSMEDNEQCNNLLAEEVLEVLCNLKELSIENDKDNDE